MLKAIVGTLLLALVCADLSSGQTPSDPLVGLWRARRWFGPDVRGPLVIRREGAIHTADLNGQLPPVRLEGASCGSRCHRAADRSVGHSNAARDRWCLDAAASARQ